MYKHNFPNVHNVQSSADCKLQSMLVNTPNDTGARIVLYNALNNTDNIAHAFINFACFGIGFFFACSISCCTSIPKITKL